MLRTRSPLLFKCIATPEKPFDLHVLTTPPAFILSQDQTLRKKRVTNPSDSWTTYWDEPEGSPRINLEYVDWGSQSIVQSKFQRTAPFLGERCSREHSRFAPSILFRKNSEKYLGKNTKPCRLSTSPLAFAASCLIEGIAENAKCVFLIKTFLIILCALIVCC